MIITDTNPSTDVQEREYLRLLGYPLDHYPGERARELMVWAREWYKENGKPWVFARTAQEHRHS